MVIYRPGSVEQLNLFSANRATFKHQQTHQPHNMVCYSFYRVFKSFSGILIYLESGTCPSDY